MIERYNPHDIEGKWQQRWEEDALYKTESAGPKPKYFVLDFYPYPSGAGMSVGHARNYVPTDVIARYKRMKGFNVLHPIGFDAYGLPTENAAIREKISPHVLNAKYSENYVRQYKLMGLSYDWSRLFNSADVTFYRWTQWIFLQLFNNWYDPRLDKATPMSALEQELAKHGNGAILDFIDANADQGTAIARNLSRITAAQWMGMSRKQQNAHLMGYRLAYRGESTVNWDPVDKVVVANEEVDNEGRAWRSGAKVVKKTLKQWFFRITAYGNRLHSDLDTVDWPDRIVTMQRNWIGKSYGAEVRFSIPDSQFAVSVYTTRPDTLWGATFMVLAPEHVLVSQIVAPMQRAQVEAYVADARGKSDIVRTSEGKDKSGVFTGAYAINPVNGARLPIWIADYVLTGYGTGAIMAVPAHDQRDFEFARKFGLDIIEVVRGPAGDPGPTAGWAKSYEDKDGVMVNSGPITGTAAGAPSIEAAIAYCTKAGFGKPRMNLKIRDWLISRQRYWGTVIPIIHTEDGEVALTEAELPIKLPDVENYEPNAAGESPLADLPEWVNTPRGRRETDTLATWACSSWYFARFSDPHNDSSIFTPKELDYFLPVDMYVGGAEHAVLHLLYARMWTKVLYDIGVVRFIEPFKALRNQGMILSAEQKTDDKGRLYYEKMSKSKGNVVTPDEVIADHGADALRGYEMFISDFSQTVPWNTTGVPGVRRWLDRVWRIVLAPEDDRGTPQTMSEAELRKFAHACLQKYERDLMGFSFNTVVSGMMEFTNAMHKARDAGLVGCRAWVEAEDMLVRMLAPIAPHMAEELWFRKGCAYSVHKQDWPQFDAEAVKEDTLEIVVQVNGKLRDRITVGIDEPESAVIARALASEGARKFIGEGGAKQTKYVKGRLVNIVA